MKKSIYLILICVLVFNCSTVSDNEWVPVANSEDEEVENPDNPDVEVTNISSLAELRDYAAKDDGNIKLAAGTYTIDDNSYFKIVAAPRYDDTNDQISDGVYSISTLLHFSGNNNVFDLTGVEIEVDTSIYPDIDNDGKINEIYISGTNNTIKGLSIKNLGDGYTATYTDGTSALMVLLAGVDNTLEDVSLYVVGSYPYGVGELLGKSTNALVALHKHSSLLITGIRSTLTRCNVITRAFGHGIVLQGATDTLIEDCYVEGEMRSTDDILAGDLSHINITQYETVDGVQVPKSVYAPGYFEKGHVVSMQEGGVRTYLDGPLSYSRTKGVTVVNTTVKNMRTGFVLVHGSGDMTIKDCTATGCESAFSGGTGITITNSKGDAQYGPLLTFPYLSGKNCVVDLKLINTESSFPPARLVEIVGSGHTISIENYENKQRATELPIVFGECTYADDKLFNGETYSDYAGSTNVNLSNKTGMPVTLTNLANSNSVITNGTVQDNGSGNSITSN